mgnify:CR=1 FL=1
MQLVRSVNEVGTTSKDLTLNLKLFHRATRSGSPPPHQPQTTSRKHPRHITSRQVTSRRHHTILEYTTPHAKSDAMSLRRHANTNTPLRASRWLHCLPTTQRRKNERTNTERTPQHKPNQQQSNKVESRRTQQRHLLIVDIFVRSTEICTLGITLSGGFEHTSLHRRTASPRHRVTASPRHRVTCLAL